MRAIYLVMKHDTQTQTETPVTFASKRKAAEAIATYAELQEQDNTVQYYVMRVIGQ